MKEKIKLLLIKLLDFTLWLIAILIFAGIAVTLVMFLFAYLEFMAGIIW